MWATKTRKPKKAGQPKGAKNKRTVKRALAETDRHWKARGNGDVEDREGMHFTPHEGLHLAMA